MIIFNLLNVPDLTLAKYKVLGKCTIDDLPDIHESFLKYILNVCKELECSLHYVILYNNQLENGKKINIYLVINLKTCDESLKKFVKNIVLTHKLAKIFQFEEVIDSDIIFVSDFYNYITQVNKQKLVKNIEIKENSKSFISVPIWEALKENRLINFFYLIESMDENLCFIMDFYPKKNINKDFHQYIDKNHMILRRLVSPKRNDILRDKTVVFEKQIGNDAKKILELYDKWIDNIDSNLSFYANISILSNNRLSGKIALESILSETLKKENYCLHQDIAECSVSSILQNNIRNVENLFQWEKYYVIDEISPFFRLPILYDGEVIQIPKETAPKLFKNGFEIGKDINDQTVKIPYDILNKHLFICGVPGSGKTNTMFQLIASLYSAKIPFMIFEPAKSEYRELVYTFSELMLFSPKSNSKFPIQINPFEFPKGIPLTEHINNIIEVFKGAFYFPSPSEFILETAVENAYKKYEWNIGDINNGEKLYPSIRDLIDQFSIELETSKYEGEIRGNILGVLETRLKSLIQREKGEIFSCYYSTVIPDEWIHLSAIIELESLNNETANFITLLLCTYIRESLKSIKPAEYFIKNEYPQHMIFLEEAHNLISSNIDIGEESANVKIASTRYIIKMLAEVRALHEGIVIADQLPSAMAPQILKNTNIKIVHRISSKDDRESIGLDLNANDYQIDNIGSFTPGQALIGFEKMVRPFYVTINKFIFHYLRNTDDESVYNFYSTQSSFKKLEELKSYSINGEQKITAYINQKRLTLFQQDLEHYIIDLKNTIDNSSLTNDIVIKVMDKIILINKWLKEYPDDEKLNYYKNELQKICQ